LFESPLIEHLKREGKREKKGLIKEGKKENSKE
jgi:hypothetical protein